MAYERKEFRNKNDEAETEDSWTDQQYIEFACLQDPNRHIDVDRLSFEIVNGEELVTVMVDSFLLPEGLDIEDVSDANTQLDQRYRTVQCSWKWLRLEVDAELALILDEAIFGIPVVDGVGLDSADPSVACRDVSTMASFTGTTTRVKVFVSPPVAHTFITLPLNDFGQERKVASKDEKLDNHSKECRAFEQYVASLGIKKKPPPLPRARYQISRLKWIPTDDLSATDAIRTEKGYYQGAYIVPDTTIF